MTSRLTWADIARIVRFKTFYLVVLLTLSGIVCILLGVLTTEATWQNILNTLGVTLITSSTISIVYEIYLRLDVEDLISSRILDRIEEAKAEKIQFSRLGLKGVGLSRSELDFKRTISDARGFLKIIGLSVPDITEEGCRLLMKRRLESEKDFFIQLLLLNPYSVLSHRRAEAPAYGRKDTYFHKVFLSIEELKQFMDELGDSNIGENQFDARLYTCIPSCSVIVTQERVIITTYSVNKTGAVSPYVVFENIDEHASIYNFFLKHFDTVWERAERLRRVSLENIRNSTLEQEAHIIEELGESRSPS